MKKVLYVGWIGYQNLGDELMFDLFKEQFSALGDSYQLDSANIEHRYLKNVPLQNFDLIVLGGGSILSGQGYVIHPYVINYLHECLQLDKKIMIWGSGIDWAPKSSIQLLEQDEEIPLMLPPHFLKRIQSVFRQSVWTGVRGPLTQKILEQAGVQSSKISGDPGFLLNRCQPAEREFDHLSKIKDNKPIIGVNWGTSFNNIYGENEVTLEGELAKALNELIQKGYHIYFYSMWKNDLPAILRLYSKLINTEHVTLDPTIYNHSDFLQLLNKFTFTINFKLHANYLSLAANTPFIALGYRFKVFDFVKSIQFDDYIISTDETKIAETILSLEQQIVQHSPKLKAKMDSYLTRYREKINEPFKHGLYL